MKGGVAVLCELFARLGPGGRAALRVDPVVVLYDQEEGPFEQSGLIAVLAARPDLRAASLAICLEPTDLAVQVGCCGSLHATFTFAGRAAHSARPWQGENAVHRAGPLLAHLAERGRREVLFRASPEAAPGGAQSSAAPLELAYYEVLSCTRIEGFTGRNVVPAGCALNLNYRFAPGRTVAEAEAELTALAERFGARCEVTDRAPSGLVALGHPLLRRLASLAGGRIEPKQAWTDVARLGAAGVPAVNFGPGEQAQAHQPGESCPVGPLLSSYQILLRLLQEGA
jgi:succinyl-diaminopimelate desuccinylase